MKKIIFGILMCLIALISCSESETGCPLNQLNRDSEYALYAIDFINDQLVNDSTIQPVVVKGEFLEIKGWALDTRAKDSAGNIHFLIGEKHFENELITKREDVATVFNMKDATNCGYSVKIPISKIGRGAFDINLAVVKKDNKSYYAPNPAKTLKVIIQP